MVTQNDSSARGLEDTLEHWKAFYYDGKPRLVHYYTGNFKMLCGYRVPRWSSFGHWGKTDKSVDCPRCLSKGMASPALPLDSESKKP